VNSVDYLAASARTASGQLHQALITPELLQAVLSQAIAAGQQADALKKTLFYGKALGAPFGSAQGTALDSAPLPERSRREGTTDSPVSCDLQAINPDILHAALGLYTEATEMLESVLATLQGKRFDSVNAFEECGDCEWYLAMFYRALGRTPEEARTANIAKLQARYPDRFSGVQAVQRDLDKERAILAAHAARDPS